MSLAVVHYSLDGADFFVDPAIVQTPPTAIPFPQDLPLFTFRIRLSERDYRFRFDWNGRAHRWFFSLSTGDGQALVRGRKLVANYPMLENDKWNPLIPPGTLIAVDFSDKQGAPPEYNEIGPDKRVKLLYYEPPVNPTPGDLVALDL